MEVLNIEIKARCRNPGQIKEVLEEHNATFKGTDRQVDTYFRVEKGRLKLREGTIENHLIYYERNDAADPKRSDVQLVPTGNGDDLKNLLLKALDITVKVEKKREIYFIENVKFHIDRVDRLGTFVEIEAIDWDGTIGEQKLKKQCETYMDLFNIGPDDLVDCSYSDLLDGSDIS